MKQLGRLLDFSGSTVLITGGARGAGAAIVRQFARTGADVAFTYRRDVKKLNTAKSP